MQPIVRYFHPSDDSYFLFGPRGTGKSTLIREFYPNGILIDLLDPEKARLYTTSPNRFKELVYANPDKQTFIIDEVQKVPELLSIVHQLIEEKQGWQFVLTGSSARKLKKTGVDLLAGRAHLKHLHPFMASELGNQFDLYKSLQLGMLPLVNSAADPKEHLKTYIALYMREEVLMEGLIRKVEQFHLFLEAISFSQASVINYSNIALDCGISSKTVESYVQILEDLLISTRLYGFTKRAKREMQQHPKFYYFDVGVYQSIRPKGPLDDLSAIKGHSIETLIFQHLRAWLDYSKLDGKLYFWRTRSGLEVDFIIYGEIGFYAVEVKASKSIKPSDLRALYEFQNDYPECKTMMLYMGEEKRLINQILCVPIQDFLISLIPNKPLE